MRPGPAVEAIRNVTQHMHAALPDNVIPLPHHRELPAMPMPQPGSSGGVMLEYKPTLYFNGTPEEQQKSFSEQLERHKDDIKRMFERMMEQQERLAF